MASAAILQHVITFILRGVVVYKPFYWRFSPARPDHRIRIHPDPILRIFLHRLGYDIVAF